MTDDVRHAPLSRQDIEASLLDLKQMWSALVSVAATTGPAARAALASRSEIPPIIDAIFAQAAALSETAPSVAKDAARYRFLRTRVSHRDGETLSPAKCYYRRWHHDTTFKPDADTHAGMFDAAIDAGMQNAAPQGNKAGTPLVEAGKGSASSTDRTLPNEPAEPASPACASPNRNVAKRLRQAFADGDWGAVEDIADLLDERLDK